MRHTLEIEEDTQVFLEEMMDKFLAGKAIRAAGEAAEGLLSNPNLAFLVAGGILAGVGAYVGKDAIDNVVGYFGSLSNVLTADSQEDKAKAVNEAAEQLRALLRLTPLGSGLIPP